MWGQEPTPLLDPRPALYEALDYAWTTCEQDPIHPYPTPVVYLPPPVLLVLFDLRDIKKGEPTVRASPTRTSCKPARVVSPISS
jgi:hypothetical protein